MFISKILSPSNVYFLDGLWTQIYETLIKDDYYKEYLKGVGMTIFLALAAIFFGSIIGSAVALAKYYNKETGKMKALKVILDIYTTVIRGTPIVVQLFVAYYIIFARSSNAINAAVITFGINSGAYLSEVMRSGLESIPKGQIEAGRSLGLSRAQTMRKIVLPQAIKVILPSVGNEFITLIKETSVVGYVTIKDLAFVQSIRSASNYHYQFPLFFIAAIYLILVLGLTFLQKKLERRFALSD